MDDVVLRARLDSLERQVKLLMEERNDALERLIKARLRREQAERFLDRLDGEFSNPNL